MSDNMAADLRSVVKSVTKDWRKIKQREDRVSRQTRAYYHVPSYRVTIREVAFEVMEDAYMKASGNGRYPANARQIMYAARPMILARADADTMDSKYFTQALLKDYLEIYRPDWDVVWDAQGHLTEPHDSVGDKRIELGGVRVKRYISNFTGRFDVAPRYGFDEKLDVEGPELRYRSILFIEKEGFDPLLAKAGIASRFDIAIASTKGMPVSALCDLLHKLDEYGCTTYVVHDFDKSGFSIVGSLRQGTRGSRGTGRKIVDLGFRLEDIEGLQREPVRYKQEENPKWNLKRNGATDEEVEILVQGDYWRGWEGERVELKAMTADQFVAWLERKLTEHGVGKFIPDDGTLVKMYRRASFLQALEVEEEKMRAEVAKRVVEVPDDLGDRVGEKLEDYLHEPWEEAIWRIALEEEDTEDEDHESGG